jgi:hypothetical protein
MAMSDDITDVVAAGGEPRLVDLHAKLLLPDADILDLYRSFVADPSCTWWTVDLERAALRPVMTLDVGARLTAMVRRKAAGTAKWKQFLSGLGVPLSNAAPADN